MITKNSEEYKKLPTDIDQKYPKKDHYFLTKVVAVAFTLSLITYLIS